VWQQVVAVGRRRSAMREAVVSWDFFFERGLIPNDLETASFIYNLHIGLEVNQKLQARPTLLHLGP
jgi:hypothetical protein